MEYTKQTWTAPTGKGLSRYAKSGESASHVTLTLDPENLTNSPTPFTMARMAHMEDGIAKAYDTAPPTPWAQYSGKDIPQLPDNVAGTTYKRDNDWVDTDGWVSGGSANLSVQDGYIRATETNTSPHGLYRTISGSANKLVIIVVRCSDTRYIYTAITAGALYTSTIVGKDWTVISFIKTTETNDNTLYIYQHGVVGGYFDVKAIYIGTGAYDRLVFDNSYHYRHLLNNAVIPTPQGLYFNGTTSYLKSKEKITLPDVFTFSATVNCAIKSTSQAFLAQNTSEQPTDRIIIYRQANNNDLNVIGTDGTKSIYFNRVGYFTGLDNTDIDLKVEIDFVSKTIKSYRNGVQFGSTVSAPTIIKPSSNYIYSGNLSNLIAGLLGYMRNICIYDTALTDTQRNWLAQGNTPPILYDVTNYKLGNADTASKANVRVSLRHCSTFFDKTWAGLSVFSGNLIWTDGNNIYYSNSTTQHVLNKTTSTWTTKTWAGLSVFSGNLIWTDGNNIYYSNSTTQHVLNKTTSTWTTKTWAGLTDFSGDSIWTDGENIYQSTSTTQHVLNKTTSTWTTKTWTGLTDFSGRHIWTDGENIYYSFVTEQYVLNKTTSTWVAKAWTGLTSFEGNLIWTDGENIYQSKGSVQFVLNKATSTWVAKTWTGSTGFNGNLIWTDGENIYYDEGMCIPATRHNYVDEAKYNSLFGTVTKCNCNTLSDRFVFRNE